MCPLEREAVLWKFGLSKQNNGPCSIKHKSNFTGGKKTKKKMILLYLVLKLDGWLVVGVMDYLFYPHSQPPWPYSFKPFVFVKFNYTGRKGTVSRDFLLQGFCFNESSSPKPPKITLGSFRILPPVSLDTGSAPSLANISANFRQKNQNGPIWYTQGLGGNWFIKKPEVENLLALSF
jgi:hypothetical protein